MSYETLGMAGPYNIYTYGNGTDLLFEHEVHGDNDCCVVYVDDSGRIFDYDCCFAIPNDVGVWLKSEGYNVKLDDDGFWDYTD